MNDPVRIIIHGAGGRMGRALMRAALERAAQFEIVAALVRAGSNEDGEPLAKSLGANTPDIDFSAHIDPEIVADAMIDFTSGPGFDSALAVALQRHIAFISGSTGLSEIQLRALDFASKKIPVLWSANFSIGVALLKRLSQLTAKTLGDEFDIEIIESHHRNKIDSPSGTALAIGAAISEIDEMVLDSRRRDGRSGIVGARSKREIGFHSIRGGDVVGEHTVLFAGLGERIELVHRAGHRDLFASGALRAAAWLKNQAPGRYTMESLLGN